MQNNMSPMGEEIRDMYTNLHLFEVTVDEMFRIQDTYLLQLVKYKSKHIYYTKSGKTISKFIMEDLDLMIEISDFIWVMVDELCDPGINTNRDHAFENLDLDKFNIESFLTIVDKLYTLNTYCRENDVEYKGKMLSEIVGGEGRLIFSL